MNKCQDALIAHVAELMSASRQGVAFSGAGISTESGIDDFRSPGGLWSRHQPVMFDDFLKDTQERRRFWRIRREMLPSMMAAQPNAGHRALATLEARGLLKGIITQNIDELHQQAGSQCVVEVHGTAMMVHCLDCDKRWPAAEIQVRLEAGEEELLCDSCGGLLKSMTVSFGQPLPPVIWQKAYQMARQCDLFLAVGSSLVVQPAAELPVIAKRRGASLIIINRDVTPLDELADVVIHERIGETLQKVLGQLGLA